MIRNYATRLLAAIIALGVILSALIAWIQSA